MRLRLLIPFAVLAVISCEHAGEARVLSVTETAAVLGLAYVDANGNGAQDASDPPRAGLNVLLVARGTRDTVAKATSNASGAYAFLGVPVGDYRVAIDTTGLGELQVVQGDSEVRLRPSDSTIVHVGVSYPRVTIAQARTLPTGRQVFVDGVALNAPALFGDTTVHLTNATDAIRATRVRAPQTPFGAGDSVRVLGRKSTRSGQPVLDDVTVFFIGAGVGPSALPVTTSQATSALGGTLDARLVRITGATISDTSRTSRGDFQLLVTDGSGPLVVILDTDAHLTLTAFQPGVSITAVGVLVPTGSGSFVLKPRFDTDFLPP